MHSARTASTISLYGISLICHISYPIIACPFR
jgi:hypothetical protein